MAGLIDAKDPFDQLNDMIKAILDDFILQGQAETKLTITRRYTFLFQIQTEGNAMPQVAGLLSSFPILFVCC